MVDELEHVGLEDLGNEGDDTNPPADPGSGKSEESPASDKGQKSDSPADKEDGAGEGKSDDSSAKSDETQGDGEGEGAGDDGDGGGKKTKPAPYDQDPKWKAARAAEKRLGAILEEHGFDTPDELQDALESGQTLQELVGNRDTKKLIEDSETLQRYETHWAQQEALRKEEEETPEQTITRQKKELQDLRDSRKAKEEESQTLKNSEKSVEQYETEVTKVIDRSEDLTDDEKQLAKLTMGVGNDAMDIDVADLKGVRKATTSQVQLIRDVVKRIRQTAVDKYAKGKSDLTPVKGTDDGSTPVKTPAVDKKPLPDNISVEDGFAQANKEFLELLTTVAE